jgi:hypothetical protein
MSAAGQFVPPPARLPLAVLLVGPVVAAMRWLLRSCLRFCGLGSRDMSIPPSSYPEAASSQSGPGLEERFLILHRLLGGHPTLTDQDLAVVAQQAKGLSRAQLNEFVTKAANLAVKAFRNNIIMEDIQKAMQQETPEDMQDAYVFAFNTSPTSGNPLRPPWQREAGPPALAVPLSRLGRTPNLLQDTRRPPKANLFVETLRRVALPALLATVVGCIYFDNLSLFLQSNLDAEALKVLGRDESQFMQNFQTVIGLLFTILAGNAYSSLYAQQENIYFALYQEVSEAKSLLEQVTLVCQGRPMYGKTLRYMKSYVENDLRRLKTNPAELLASKPSEDPLESIMYLTSVGVPSVVYETVRSLRQARAYRLGAMQRKFPSLGIVLLYVLAILVLIPFPLLSAGALPKTTTAILWIQSSLFGFLAGSIVLCLRIIQELWQMSGGVFNVDEVLLKMVSGLQEELDIRSSGLIIVDAGPDRPALPRRVNLDLSAYPPTWPNAARDLDSGSDPDSQPPR